MFSNIDFFSELTEKELETFGLFCQKRKFSNGEVIFEKGDDATAMYLIDNGFLEVIDENKILGVVKAGDIVGEMALFGKNNKRTATVKAISDSVVIVILRFSIDELIKKHPFIYQKIKNIIEKRLEENNKSL
ncbi:MAG: cyclic nucleotide-binding domain-containing protein [Candidatus Gracilibacteria bacterium]|nr:cyclic nucleotide-binding domain-containing protein [Candidatus Gracilibacteria bacterium]